MAEDIWIMHGLEWNDPLRICSWKELVSWINDVGFLPLFRNEIPGFSAEEHVHSWSWWTDDPEQDPWIWREIIARSHQVVYGKFFDKKAGFISVKWLPFFANFRRNGYDFDALWDEGLAGRREKNIMDLLTGRDDDGDMIFPEIRILSTDLKKRAGFGKGGAKNYPGIVNGLQMQTYLVITDFTRRRNKRGSEYGMPVSILQPPETVWGYEKVTSAYEEAPAVSWERVFKRVEDRFPGGTEKNIIKIIGKRPL